MGLGRDDHVVDDGRRMLDAQHARDREAPDIGVDHGDRLALLGERDAEVGRDRRLADAALARRDEHRAGAVAGFGEGDGAPFGVAVRSLRARSAGRVAVHQLSDLGPLLIGHHAEVDRDEVDAVERLHRVGDLGLDLIAERAARDGEVDADLDVTTVDRGGANHPEVDDAAVQLGILNRTQRVDDSGFSDRHGQGVAFRYFSYGHR